MAEKEQAGRGKKQCASCLKFTGVRSQICPHCKTPFPTKEKVGGESKPKSTAKPSLAEFIATLNKVKEWGEPYKTWKDAKDVVNSVLSIVDEVGGKTELMALLDYLEENEG